jgi:hypothetical protein
MTLTEMLMAWRLGFTRGLLKKAQGWHRESLFAQMRLQEREEGKYQHQRELAEIRQRCAEHDYDAAYAERRALNEGKV